MFAGLSCGCCSGAVERREGGVSACAELPHWRLCAHVLRCHGLEAVTSNVQQRAAKWHLFPSQNPTSDLVLAILFHALLVALMQGWLVGVPSAGTCQSSHGTHATSHAAEPCPALQAGVA